MKAMKEQAKGTVVVIPPEEPESAEHLLMRIFGMTAKEYAEDLLRRRKESEDDAHITAVA